MITPMDNFKLNEIFACKDNFNVLSFGAVTAVSMIRQKGAHCRLGMQVQRPLSRDCSTRDC